MRHTIAIAALIAVITIGTAAIQQTPPDAAVPHLPRTADGFPPQNFPEGPWLYFLGTLVSTFVALYVQKRNRQWDVEDRARIAAELERKTTQTAEELKRTTEDEASKVRDTAEAIADHLLHFLENKHAVLNEKLEANTDVSVKAFEAANSFHAKVNKIERIIESVSASKGRRATDQTLLATAGTIQSIEQTGEDTNERVRKVEEKVAHDAAQR